MHTEPLSADEETRWCNVVGKWLWLLLYENIAKTGQNSNLFEHYIQHCIVLTES